MLFYIYAALVAHTLGNVIHSARPLGGADIRIDAVLPSTIKDIPIGTSSAGDIKNDDRSLFFYSNLGA